MTRWPVVAARRWDGRWCSRRRWQEVVIVLLLVLLLRVMMRIGVLVAYGCVYSPATLAAAVRGRWGGGVAEGAPVTGPMGLAVEPKGF